MQFTPPKDGSELPNHAEVGSFVEFDDEAEAERIRERWPDAGAIRVSSTPQLTEGFGSDLAGRLVESLGGMEAYYDREGETAREIHEALESDGFEVFRVSDLFEPGLLVDYERFDEFHDGGLKLLYEEFGYRVSALGDGEFTVVPV